MSNRPLSPQDLEQLSAYLDEQLSAAQKARLEARLAESIGLRETLDELRRTRAMLRSLPRLRAPRNFTLTPQMAGQKARTRRVWWQTSPVWGLASLVATLLFAVMFVGDFMGLFTPTMQAAAIPSSEDSVVLVEQMSALEKAAATQQAESAGGQERIGQDPDVTVEATGEITTTAAFSLTAEIGEPGMLMAPNPNADSESQVPMTTTLEISSTVEGPVVEAGNDVETLILYTPAWVRVVELALLAVAAVGAALAIYFNRR